MITPSIHPASTTYVQTNKRGAQKPLERSSTSRLNLVVKEAAGESKMHLSMLYFTATAPYQSHDLLI